MFVLILISASFYFNVLPYIIRFFNIEVVSSYYTINSFNDNVFILSFVYSLIFFFVSSSLLYVYHLSGGLSKNIEYEVYIPLWVEVSLIVLVFFVTKEYFQLTRDLIKSDSNLAKEILIISTVSICSYHLLLKPSILLGVLRFAFIFYVAMVTFEREFVLFAVLPLIFKVKITPKKVSLLIAFSIVILSLVISYKSLVNYAKSGVISLPNNNFMYSLGVDTVHKMSLELSYVDGKNVPDFNDVSLIAPYQVFRILQNDRTTNSRIATSYYTDGKTGTGFSSWLEGYINYGILGLAIIPLLLILIFHFSTGLLGKLLLIPLLVFSIKLNRSELWPLLISMIILPSIFILFISKLRRKSE